MSTTEEIEIKPINELPSVDNNTTVYYHHFKIEANTYTNIEYNDFFNNHMRKNIPCIIKNVGTDWDASTKWVKDGKIDYEYLTNQYGTLTVPVVDCKNIKFDSQPRTEMKFSDYLNYLKSYDNTKDKLLYLKDWHLKKCKPTDSFYTVPPWFASDWLNDYCQDKKKDDFMFVYMGPKGSWTPLHADVYSSFSWSVNVIGRKKWILFPPGEDEKLRDKYKNVVLQFDPEMFKDKRIIYYEIIQEKGDALFVPSNWYHQVENLLDTISINHNWINGCNIIQIWRAIKKSLASVEKEIEKLKDVPEYAIMCQKILKELFGMDYEEFTKMLLHTADKRLQQYDRKSKLVYNNVTLGKNHCFYDLKRMHDLLIILRNDPNFGTNNYTLHQNLLFLQDYFICIFR